VPEVLAATHLTTAEPESSNVVMLDDGERVRSAKS
jgi:hypothetical protein